MGEHPEDICYCGDYRKEHPDNGACGLNGLGHNPNYKCEKFRLCGGEKGIVVADANQTARKTRRRKPVKAVRRPSRRIP